MWSWITFHLSGLTSIAKIGSTARATPSTERVASLDWQRASGMLGQAPLLDPSPSDVVDQLGGCNPRLCLDVVDRRLNPLRILLGKKPQVFTGDFDFGPNAFRQHRKNQDASGLRPLIKRNCLYITLAFSYDLESADYIPQFDRQ
jgi:hypothetical protein